jgi:hypothetical protein
MANVCLWEIFNNSPTLLQRFRVDKFLNYLQKTACIILKI